MRFSRRTRFILWIPGFEEKLYMGLHKNAMIFSLMPWINSMALCLPSKADCLSVRRQNNSSFLLKPKLLSFWMRRMAHRFAYRLTPSSRKQGKITRSRRSGPSKWGAIKNARPRTFCSGSWHETRGEFPIRNLAVYDKRNGNDCKDPLKQLAVQSWPLCSEICTFLLWHQWNVTPLSIVIGLPALTSWQ
jgi:hypothetical protein